MKSLCGPQHRHRDVCRLYKLEPCKVVTEYAMHLEGAKLLKPGTSRLFEEEDTHGIDNSPPESTLTGSETGPKGKQVDRSALSVSNTKVKKPVAPSRKRDLATRSPEKVDPASKRTRISTRSMSKAIPEDEVTGKGDIIGPPALPQDPRSNNQTPATPLPTTRTTATKTGAPQPSPIPAGPSHGVQLTQTTIWYADLAKFDEQASDPTLSAVGLENLRSKARSIQFREKSEAEGITMKMKDRRAIWEGVLARLNKRISKAGGTVLVEAMRNE
jgi:hypothetical protein